MAKLFQNLRSSRQTELCCSSTHLVCRWMGNTEAIAINHYLQETGQHLAQACTIPTANPTAELGAHTGADTAVMSPQAPSEKSQALENKAFPSSTFTVSHRNASSGDEDSNVGSQSLLYIEATLSRALLGWQG